jgi:two-component system, chemotaxis family, chemotaxis protein CheY
VNNSVDESYVYTRALRAAGYRVVNAATTVLAYQIAITQPTDIVVTDGHCAGSMSGLELTRRLRIHTRTTTVPIIVITSETRRQDGELSIKAGADMFLEKPVSGDVLRDHVVRLLVACGHLPASCRRSTNVFVPYAATLIAPSERARNVVDSWNIGTSRRSSRRWK